MAEPPFRQLKQTCFFRALSISSTCGNNPNAVKNAIRTRENLIDRHLQQLRKILISSKNMVFIPRGVLRFMYELQKARGVANFNFGLAESYAAIPEGVVSQISLQNGKKVAVCYRICHLTY